MNISTKTGGFAADLLQVQPSVTIGSIHDCRLDHHVRVVRGQQIYPAAGEVIVPFQALRRSGTQFLRCAQVQLLGSTEGTVASSRPASIDDRGGGPPPRSRPLKEGPLPDVLHNARGNDS